MQTGILALKRNLNWMAHVISRRELQLQEELAQTHEDKQRFASMSMLDPLTGLVQPAHPGRAAGGDGP